MINLLVPENVRINEVLHAILMDHGEEGVLFIFHLIANHIVEFPLQSSSIYSRFIHKFD